MRTIQPRRIAALVAVLGVVLGLALALSPVGYHSYATGSGYWGSAADVHCGSAVFALDHCHAVARDRLVLATVVGAGIVLLGIAGVALLGTREELAL